MFTKAVAALAPRTYLRLLAALALGLLLLEGAALLAWQQPVGAALLHPLGDTLLGWWRYEVAGVQLGTVLLVGFAAQLVDGALGMAYGLCSTSFLLGLGLPPALASASVHVAEMGTTGASGLAHWRAGNVDMRLWRRLVLPGAVGALLGVGLLTQIDGKALKPWIDAYLLLTALWLLLGALRRRRPASVPAGERRVGLLATAGGLLDALGGGGWGPIVTGNLLRRADQARVVIGTVCAAEFMIAAITGIALALSVGLLHWQIIAALLLGGVLAAPLAARLCGLLPQRLLLLAVGLLLAGLSLRSLWPWLG